MLIDRLAGACETQITARGADLHMLLAHADQTIQHAHELVGNVQAMTSERAGAGLNIKAALRDLAAASAALRGFASDVEQNPQLLLTGRRP